MPEDVSWSHLFLHRRKLFSEFPYKFLSLLYMISLVYKISHCLSANHNPKLRRVICTGGTLSALVLHFLHPCYTRTVLLSANQNRVIFSCGIFKLVIKTKLLDILCVDKANKLKTERKQQRQKTDKQSSKQATLILEPYQLGMSSRNSNSWSCVIIRQFKTHNSETDYGNKRKSEQIWNRLSSNVMQHNFLHWQLLKLNCSIC